MYLNIILLCYTLMTHHLVNVSKYNNDNNNKNVVHSINIKMCNIKHIGTNRI